jgi:hypothetical protein
MVAGLRVFGRLVYTVCVTLCGHGPTAGITIRLVGTFPALSSVRATFLTLCALGTYSAPGTGFPPCQPCPPGRFGGTLGLTSPSCSGLCDAPVRPSTAQYLAGDSYSVCSEGAVRPQGVSTATYTGQGFMEVAIPVPQGLRGSKNVAMALMDREDKFPDLVSGQFWYQNDGSAMPSFTPHEYCVDPTGDTSIPFEYVYPLE